MIFPVTRPAAAPADGADPPCQDAPGTRRFRPAFDEEARRSAADFVRARGETLRPVYVALCLACWLRRHGGRESVSGADIRALFPTTDDGRRRPLRNPTDVLRRARDAGLLTSAGGGWYAVTPLGDAVADALPDLDAVVAMLGRAGAKCAARRRGWAALR